MSNSNVIKHTQTFYNLAISVRQSVTAAAWCVALEYDRLL